MSTYSNVVICDSLQVALPDCTLPVNYTYDDALDVRAKDKIVIARNNIKQDHCIVYVGLDRVEKIYNGNVNGIVAQLQK